MNNRSTAVVIVNYRTPGLVVDCLRTLAGEVAREPALRAVVVDNASGDDSLAVLAAAIRDHGWKWAGLKPLDRNGGFAFGNNAAARELLAGPSPPAYVWLLNPDTLVPDISEESVRSSPRRPRRNLDISFSSFR